MHIDWDGRRAGEGGEVAPGRRQQLIEVTVFLFLIAPSMVLSFWAGEPRGLSFSVVALANMLRDLSLLALVLYLIWRNGEGFGAIGWTFRNGWREAVLGLWLFVPIYLGAALFAGLLRGAGLSAPESLPAFLIPQGTGELLLALVFLMVVAVSEETIFRGYLMLRLKALTGSPAATVILSAAVFSVGHGYQGSAGVITVGLLGVLFGLVYLWRGSLIAPMVMHFIQNFIGIVVAPLLGSEGTG